MSMARVVAADAVESATLATYRAIDVAIRRARWCEARLYRAQTLVLDIGGAIEGSVRGECEEESEA